MGILLPFTLSLLFYLFSPILRVQACDNVCSTTTTYTMITPSPNAIAYPVTRQFQEVHTYIPEYAVCNPDNSDCTTVYSMRTYNWCSAVVPCYGRACTVTDCAQWITFSHANTYNLRTAVCGEGGVYTIRGTPTTAAAPAVATSSSSSVVYYVEAIVTRYAVSYRDYSEGKYSRVRVERCPKEEDDDRGLCDFWYERWVEQVYEEEEVVVIVPVTVNTYCPEPTTITYAGSTVTVLGAPTTVVFVTESRVTSTTTTTNTTTAYATSQYSSSQSSSYEIPTSAPTSSSTTRHFSIPQYPAFETPYPRPSPTNYPPTTPTPRYPASSQHPQYPSKGYEEGEEEEEEEEENDPEYHTYGRFKDSEGVHEWGRFYDSELRKRELWGEYEDDDEEAHSYGRYEEYKRQREQKVHWGGSSGHKYDDKASNSFE